MRLLNGSNDISSNFVSYSCGLFRLKANFKILYFELTRNIRIVSSEFGCALQAKN